ncbi:hypothetical protein WJX72_001342 [[Myrmecia] bisecta]|uniref:F-box domain-containing protein n=1 Tax=[Myrmecia] bisecta TaxID=41462 RepID=A0AAW1R5F6_9CHLO
MWLHALGLSVLQSVPSLAEYTDGGGFRMLPPCKKERRGSWLHLPHDIRSGILAFVPLCREKLILRAVDRSFRAALQFPTAYSMAT